MLLKISQEISSISQSAASAVDLITNERIVETTVIVDDGQILVLGGLLEDTLRESDQRVPLLGRMPLLGNLFRSRKTEKVKTNLMIFIRPKILRDSVTTSIETNQKYNLIRNIQQGRGNDDPALMPGTERPMLPELSQPEAECNRSRWPQRPRLYLRRRTPSPLSLPCPSGSCRSRSPSGTAC